MTGFKDGQRPVEALELPGGHRQDKARREARLLNRDQRTQDFERPASLVAIEMIDDVAQPVIARRDAVRLRHRFHV
jgi:hypothetical protein